MKDSELFSVPSCGIYNAALYYYKDFQSVISLKNHENEKTFILFHSLYHYNGYYFVYVLSRWETCGKRIIKNKFI